MVFNFEGILGTDGLIFRFKFGIKGTFEGIELLFEFLKICVDLALEILGIVGIFLLFFTSSLFSSVGS